MNKTIYVCEKCKSYSSEDFWGCQKCQEVESKVLQVIIKDYKDSMIFSFINNETTYEKCYAIVKEYLSSKNLKYDSMYSQHNYQLEVTYFDVVVRVSNM
jgi:recombinational DNA repair protein RecR